MDEAYKYIKCSKADADATTRQIMEEAQSKAEALPAKGIAKLFKVINNAEGEEIHIVGAEYFLNAANATNADNAKNSTTPSTALVLPGRAISKFIADSSFVVCACITLGVQSEQLLKRESLVGALRGVAFDACTSSLIDCALDSFQASISAQLAPSGLQCTSRFSPGYADLPLDVQPAFIAALNATRELGVTLTPQNLMIPRKSITAVIKLQSL
jgi:hypothetical protein